jgi:hypothetical protein
MAKTDFEFSATAGNSFPTSQKTRAAQFIVPDRVETFYGMVGKVIAKRYASERMEPSPLRAPKLVLPDQFGIDCHKGTGL